MPDYDEDVRTPGPTVIRSGPSGNAALLVLDPAGIGKHGELPPTWRPLTEVMRVVWCRLPAAQFDAEVVIDLLEELGGVGVHLVTSGPTAVDALALAESRRDSVRSVFLVDPDPGPEGPSIETLSKSLLDQAIEVRQLAEYRDPEEDYGSDPLPLGHPAVVRELTQYLS